MFTVSHSIMDTNGSTTVENSPDSMAQQANSLARASLRDLPKEVLVFVMERIPDFSTLNNLINAVRGMAAILEGFQKRIFTGVLRSSGLSLQLQKIITAIMTIREQYPATPCPPKTFFDRYLDRKDQPVNMMKFANPTGMLRYIARTTESMNGYIESFVRMRILGRDMTAFPVSDRESYRVHRAFWRFQLCYELTHPGGSVDVRHNAEAPERWARRYISNEDGIPMPRPMKGWLYGRGEPKAPLLKDFLQTLSPWEIEEINVARFHLTTKVNAFQYNRIAGSSDDLRNQNSLLQRLVMDLDNWHEDPENPSDHLLVADLWVSQRDPHLCHDPVWPGNPPEVGSINVYPANLNGLQYARAQWGWCMWDVSRLRASGFTGPSDYTEEARIENASQSVFWNRVKILAFIDAQFSAIDNELSTRFRRQLHWELQAYEQERHMRRKEWLMTWISTRSPGLYREWRNVCARTPFDAHRAQTCYLRARTLKKAADAAKRAHPQLIERKLSSVEFHRTKYRRSEDQI